MLSKIYILLTCILMLNSCQKKESIPEKYYNIDVVVNHRAGHSTLLFDYYLKISNVVYSGIFNVDKIIHEYKATSNKKDHTFENNDYEIRFGRIRSRDGKYNYTWRHCLIGINSRKAYFIYWINSPFTNTDGETVISSEINNYNTDTVFSNINSNLIKKIYKYNGVIKKMDNVGSIILANNSNNNKLFFDSIRIERFDLGRPFYSFSR